MRLYDCARIIRSKNAGPFTLTIDLMFATQKDFARVLRAPDLTPERIAALYRVAPARVHICPFERVLAVKVTMPRPSGSSGAPGDRDVYGSQQHVPLGTLKV